MIGRADLVERVSEWGLREDVVEKDYVLGWILAGIGSDSGLSDAWVFKGGTCLKKCYIETYRFSEDLDFTLLPHASRDPEELLATIKTMLDRVTEASGISFSQRDPVIRVRPDSASAEARVYYVGPRQSPSPARIKFDLSFDEKVLRPPFCGGSPIPTRTHSHPHDRCAAIRSRKCSRRSSVRWASAGGRETCTTSSTSFAAMISRFIPARSERFSSTNAR